MSVLGTLLFEGGKALISWTVPKALDFLSNLWSGGKGSSGGQQHAMQQGGMRTTKLPGGANVSQISNYPPGLQEFIKQNEAELIKEIMAKPEKYKDLNQLMQQRQEIFGDPADEFGPIAEQARQRFHGETIPGLAERFTSITGGGQRSGAFARQQTRAGERLDSRLAAVQSGMGSQQRAQKFNELSLLQQNMQGRRQQQQSRQNRLLKILTGGYENVIEPAQQQSPGFWAGVGQGVGKGIGQTATTYGPDIVDWITKLATPDLNTGIAT